MKKEDLTTPALLRNPPQPMPAEIPASDIVEIDKFRVRKKPKGNSASPDRELDSPNFSPAPQKMVVSYQFTSPEDLAGKRNEKYYYWLIQDRDQPPLRIQVQTKAPLGFEYRYECCVPTS
ncbi:MAG: hypothetical protein ABJF10_20250 [Chthoniobacter sp.]|uniref:hypothetical protein n=1 Tax=Chthoniobacter sp. TaxID=2510640 RepID=UPI0032A644CB